MSVEVCASVLARACKSAAGEVVAANGGAAGSPGPSAQESCIDVAGWERSSRSGAGPEAPAGSGAQSVPGTWGPLRRGINRKQIEEAPLSGLPGVGVEGSGGRGPAP